MTRGWIGQAADKWKEGKIKMSKVHWIRWNKSSGGSAGETSTSTNPEFPRGNKPEKLNVCQLYWPPNRWMLLLGWGGGNLNKLKNLEGKPRWQRVWRPDPARELNTARMLGLRNSRERWPLNPEQGWLSDGGYWRTVNLPRNRGRKERSSVQPLQKLGAWWEWARWTKCWGSLRAQLNPGGDC